MVAIEKDHGHSVQKTVPQTMLFLFVTFVFFSECVGFPKLEG